MQNQAKKIKEVPASKILQILPRENTKPSSPRLVDITPDQPSASTSDQVVPPHKIVDKAQNNRTEVSQKEVPNEGKEDKSTQISAPRIQNLQIEKISLSFNLRIEISKQKISVPLIELIKNENYKSQIT